MSSVNGSYLPDASPAAARQRERARIWLTRFGMVLGLLLMVGALLTVWNQREEVLEAFRSVERFSWPTMFALAAAVLANVVLTGLMFSILKSRYGRVGLVEMQAVMAAATLLNYLPLRPGLMGRFAYHKSVNAIRFRDSAMVMMQASALSVGCVTYLTTVVVLMLQFGLDPWLLVLLPYAPLVTGCFLPGWRVWSLAVLVRYTELMVWTVRYQLAFRLLGLEVDLDAAVVMACISAVTSMIPFLSNGAGLREWANGLAAQNLSRIPLELGLTGELLNRMAEIVVVALCGIPAVYYLARLKRRRDRERAEAELLDLEG